MEIYEIKYYKDNTFEYWKMDNIYLIDGYIIYPNNIENILYTILIDINRDFSKSTNLYVSYISNKIKNDIRVEKLNILTK